MPLVQPNEVNKIAMFAGRSIDPVANSPTLGFEQANVKTAPGRACHIPNHPVPPFAATGWEVMAADGLNILREPFREYARTG